MAGDWLAVRLDLFDDPAVIGICAKLGFDTDMVVGRLIKLWSWANKHLHDGVAKGISVQWVDQYVSAPGFAAAMIESGWLQDRSGAIHFPKFDVWNSKSAKKRLLDSRRKTMKRAERPCPQNVRDLSALQTDKNVARGEERRGEKRREVGGGRDRLDQPAARPPVLSETVPDRVREVAARAVEVYQTRRYKTPNPAAAYYPVLLQEAVDVFGSQPDCQAALDVFLDMCSNPTLPEDAPFSAIAIACGLKRKKAKYQPPKSTIKDYTAERLAREAAERLAGQMAVG